MARGKTTTTSPSTPFRLSTSTLWLQRDKNVRFCRTKSPSLDVMAVPEGVLRGMSQLARRKNGVITWEQLLAAGLTPAMIRTLLKRGFLTRLFRGGLRLGGSCTPPAGPRERGASVP